MCISDSDASDIPWELVCRVRRVVFAFNAYALLATRADEGAVLDASKLED